ncbi:VanW family protein [Arcanobacterium phocae]|uniref:VanW family protein n=1 Tax=Arcanobacterium phocae TaxID=131112 RepID=UPI001C0EE603|nr:VanW family protein [Arcanobacterium phocae]
MTQQRMLSILRSRYGIIGISAIVIVIGYLALAVALANHIPAGTKVSGVDVSGLSKQQAQQTLAHELDSMLHEQREVKLSNVEHDPVFLDPEGLELQVDTERTLDRLTGFSLNPLRLWRHMFGGDNFSAFVRTNSESLATQLDAISETTDRAARDATIRLEEAQPVVEKAVDGVKLDKERAADVIEQSWLTNTDAIVLPAAVTEAQVTTETATEYVDTLLTPLLEKPLSLTIKEKLVELSPAQIAAAMTIEYKDGFAFSIDSEKIRDVVEQVQPGLLTAPKDASIAIENSAVKITPAVDGEAINTEALVSDMVGVVKSKNRTVTVQIDVEKPKLSTADIEGLGVKEIVAEISTPFYEDPVRSTNLRVGSSYVTNTLVRPGETFDLQTALGPLEESRGFVRSGVIVNGFPATDIGGGLSQLATNVFNVGYRAGLEDVAHKPHTVYYDRYPMGLESTIWYDQIFVKWKNTTPYGVLIESFLDGSKITTRLWSTKYYDVQLHQGKPYDFVKAQTKRNPASDCKPSTYKKDGFSVEVGRTVSLNGEQLEDSRNVVHYDPLPAVTCD